MALTTIEVGKKYRTRDKRCARIYAVDAGGELSVHGAIYDSDTKVWMLSSWTKDGEVPMAGWSDLVAPWTGDHKRWRGQ